VSDAKGWRTARLDELCDINPPKPDLATIPDATEVLFVPMAAVGEDSGVIVSPDQSTVGAVGRKSYRSFGPGDVLFAKITPCMENGKAAVVPPIPSGLGFGSTEFHVLRPKPGTDARLIWHLVRQEAFRNEAAHHFTGTVGQLRVPVDFLRSYEVLVPASDQQQADLATVLDVAAASTGRASKHLSLARTAIERFREPILAAACSGRLTADWRNDHAGLGATPPDPASPKRHRSAEAPLDLELPDLPETYVLTTVGTVATLLDYGTSRKADDDVSGLPMLRMGNIQDGRLDIADLKYCTADQEIARLTLQAGDLLFNRTNSPELVGKSAVFHNAATMTFASYLIRVRFAPGVADADFVNYWINSAWGRMWARYVKTDGVSQSNINGSKLAAMPLPLPPYAEQQEVVRRVEALLDRANRLTTAINAATGCVSRTSQALLAKAFRGKLSPNGAEVA
jgi:type I restriction enzyme S subunit